jgi:alkanesulfonate monooxygenase
MRLRIFVEPQQGATYEDQLGVALVAEGAGFDAFFRSDHFLTIGAPPQHPGPTDSWITLGALARETTSIRLGTLVTSATFRHPGLLAVAVAQVDEMSAGRVELGIGAGWYDDEHRAAGIPFPPRAERFEILDEQLSILSGLFATTPPDRFSFSGRHFTLIDSPALPQPVQEGGIPIILGGSGPRRTPALAARFADEFNTPFLQPHEADAQFQRLRAACEAIGRDPATLRLSSTVVVCCGEDESTLERRAGAMGRDLAELRTNGAAGSPAEVAARLDAYRALGAEVAYLQILDMSDHDHLRLIAEEVAPLLS